MLTALLCLLILTLFLCYDEVRDYFRPRRSLSGRLVLITGAAGGLGRQLAREFAAAGARLLLWDVRMGALEELSAWLVQEHGASPGALHIRCVDVSDGAAVATAMAEAAAALGPVSVLVNNAAVVRGHSVMESSVGEIRQSFGVNALAHWWCAKAALPGMVAAGRGTVVTVSSVMAGIPSARMADYSATKAAVAQLHHCLRWELRCTGVRCLLVQPFMIRDTPLFRGGAPIRYRALRPLLPLLEASAVAVAVVDGVRAGRERLVLPFFLRHVVALLPWLPTFLHDLACDVGGAATAMEGFVGRSEHE